MSALQGDYWKKARYLWLDRETAYADNHTMVKIAIAFAKAEPETVELYLDEREAEYRERDRSSWWKETCYTGLAAVALARQWTGDDGKTRTLLKRIERLEKLLYRAADGLRAAGNDVEADYVRAEMKKQIPW